MNFEGKKNTPSYKKSMKSFDGGVVIDTKFILPDRYRFFDQTNSGFLICQGAGMSYSAASFDSNSETVSHKLFNRIVSFDNDTKLVEVECGITLNDLYQFLLSKNLFLPVQPGHSSITVGGCIAADVHGKNHYRDGTFINQVESLKLFHPSYGFLTLSRKKNPDIFFLTCGGYGLTGHILTATLRTMRITSNLMKIRTTPFLTFSEGMTLLRKYVKQSDFIYTWHDFSNFGNLFGSGIVFQGNFSQSRTLSNISDDKTSYLSSNNRADFYFNYLNKISLKSMNYLFKLRSTYNNNKVKSLRDILFPAEKSEIYFKLFGKAGFHEYQVIIPEEHIIPFYESVKRYINSNDIVITLASTKYFKGENTFLRFTGNGFCFSLNFPRCNKSINFLKFLDKKVIEFGGTPNIIKDSRLPKCIVDLSFPQVDIFRKELQAFDPKKIFRSELSSRLGL
jgi:decaprenylphospho-beta-D-ribofuranose 2-oxidase